MKNHVLHVLTHTHTHTHTVSTKSYLRIYNGTLVAFRVCLVRLWLGKKVFVGCDFEKSSFEKAVWDGWKSAWLRCCGFWKSPLTS
jgi:hypothetical protein